MGEKNQGYDIKLAEALRSGNNVLIEQLLAAGADPDSSVDKAGTPLLIYALEKGNSAIALMLLDHGADPKRLKKGGRTALMYACKNGMADITDKMLATGVNPNQQNGEGQTALMYAANSDDNLKCAALLLEYGADVNLPDREKKTPLMWAAHYGCSNMVKLFLERGADVKCKDSFGDTVFSYVETAVGNSANVLDVLKSRGSNMKPLCFGYRLQFRCPHCGQPVMVNGPLRSTSCNACLSRLNLNREFWKEVFEISTVKGEILDSNSGAGVKLDCRCGYPECSKCKSQMDPLLVEAGADRDFPCPKCGTLHAAFPAPDWIRILEVKGRHALQVYCAGEREGQSAAAAGEGLKSVAVSCVSCGASLPIREDTPRTPVCAHCGTSQYLPDQLWNMLHPAKKREWWFILFR